MFEEVDSNLALSACISGRCGDVKDPKEVTVLDCHDPGRAGVAVLLSGSRLEAAPMYGLTPMDQGGGVQAPMPILAGWVQNVFGIGLGLLVCLAAWTRGVVLSRNVAATVVAGRFNDGWNVSLGYADPAFQVDARMASSRQGLTSGNKCYFSNDESGPRSSTNDLKEKAAQRAVHLLGQRGMRPMRPTHTCLEVIIYQDGRVLGSFRCDRLGASARMVGTGLSCLELDEHGVQVSGIGLQRANELIRAWQRTGVSLHVGRTYFPTDGVKFLLAVVGTLQGSRLWANPRLLRPMPRIERSQLRPRGMRGMATIEIVPRTSASSDELKQLARTVQRFVRGFDEPDGFPGAVILAGLEELQAGELPLPLGVLFGNLATKVCRTIQERRRRPVIVEVFESEDDDQFERLLFQHAIRSRLKAYFSRKSVGEVLVDGED